MLTTNDRIFSDENYMFSLRKILWPSTYFINFFEHFIGKSLKFSIDFCFLHADNLDQNRTINIHISNWKIPNENLLVMRIEVGDFEIFLKIWRMSVCVFHVFSQSVLSLTEWFGVFTFQPSCVAYTFPKAIH